MNVIISSLFVSFSRHKRFILTLFFLLVIIPVFSLNYKDIRFRDDNLVIINQLEGHHGLMEMYVHIYSSVFLFIACIISILVLYEQFKDSSFTWRPMMAGIFVTGMIGLSDGIDHLFAVYVSSGFIALAGHNFFHFIHEFGGPIAIFFFFRGTKEYSMQFREGGKPMSKTRIITLLSVLPLLALLATVSSIDILDVDIANTTGFIVTVATLILAGLTIRESYRQWEVQSFLMGYISLLAVSVSLLFVTILVSMNSYVLENAYLYALSYSLKDIFHVVTAALIILFTVSMHIMLSDN
ncbi:MAG: hypothetical protein K0A89_05565 [ANME-2 cluster archaeon]|nr:hypothetical protein [ANME-2 cluster archaeon]